MSGWFKLALIVHILGILVLFGAITLEFVGLLLLRRATTVGQVSDVGGVMRKLGMLFGLSGAAILLSGIYMTIIRMQHHQSLAWVVVSLVLFIAMAAVGNISGEKMSKAMQQVMSASKGSMTPEIEKLARRNPAQVSASFGPWAVTGLVALMVLKPNALISVLVLLISLLAGLVTHRQLFGREPVADAATKQPVKA